MKPMSRRNFIRAGAATMSIPFLECLPSFAHAQTASGSLRRILFFGLSNAQYENLLMPTQKNWTTGAEGVRYIPLSSISGDISAIFTANKYNHLRSKMNIMRGFDLLSAEGTFAAGHECLIPLGACGEDTPAGSRVMDSIDTVIANSSQFYSSTPFRRVLNAVPVNSQGHRYNYSWQGGNQRSLLAGPSKIYADFFSGSLPGGGAAPVDTNLSRRLAMEAALAKMTALKSSPRLSANDKQKIDQHATMISQLMPSLAPPSGGGSGPGAGCAKPTLPSGINESFNSSSGNQVRLRACLDQIFMAFNCQLTNMAVFHPVVASDTGNWEMGDGGNDVYHQMAGHHYQPELYLQYNGWVYDQLLYLLNLMEGTTESNGRTMLDNSLVVVVSNDACGVHSWEDFPIVTFGTLGGLLKAGNYINYQRTTAKKRSGGSLSYVPAPTPQGLWTYNYDYNLGRPIGSFYNTLLNVLNIPHSGFGAYSDAGGNYSEFTTAAAKQKSLPIIT